MTAHKTTATSPAKRPTPAPKRNLPPGLRRFLDREILGQKTSLWLVWLLCAGLVLFLLSALAVLGGFGSGRATHLRWLETAGVGNLQTQFDLGLQELQSGSYDRARQRFEFILGRDPSYPGAQERLVEVLAILNATATPTPLPATLTPTPTRDLRPVEDLFNAARASFASGDWDAVIDQLLALRTADSQYRVAEVDGMLYVALRNRGVDKILNRRNLEGGAFDLALAERFGPLDVKAGQARELARLYALGLSFWEVYPEQAVFYFGQVAAAAPYLSDASGWTAQARYSAALAQWGDQLLSAGDPCAAQEKYELASQAGAGGEVQDAAARAAEACSPPTEIPSPTDLATETPTATLQPGTAVPTTAAPSATQTSTLETTPAFTAAPTETSPAATSSPTMELSPTPSPTTAPTESLPTEEPTSEETRAPVEPAVGETAAP